MRNFLIRMTDRPLPFLMRISRRISPGCKRSGQQVNEEIIGFDLSLTRWPTATMSAFRAIAAAGQSPAGSE